MLNLQELDLLLKKYNATYEILFQEKPIHSVKDAKLYFNVDQMAPVLVISTEKGFFAVIISGERGRIDFEIIKNVLSCKQVKLASKEEVYETTGYETGRVPLVGHGLPCVFDSMLLKHSQVYGGTGNLNYTLKIDPHNLIELNKIVAYIE